MVECKLCCKEATKAVATENGTLNARLGDGMDDVLADVAETAVTSTCNETLLPIEYEDATTIGQAQNLRSKVTRATTPTVKEDNGIRTFP